MPRSSARKWNFHCTSQGEGKTMAHGHTASLHGLPIAGELMAATPARQAYQVLHFGFAAAPLIAGLDKFFHVLTNWDMYLAPWVAKRSPIGGHNLMLLVGVVEIIAGLIV